mmetsp:Transcript_11555/g.10025  ORF Transcript_11555/g.10025 Transcript_11555/m.10025 type:complete len:148 (+) Transcript_11555:452-895(+)
MNKFFEKVEATKPEASRTQSAEIFVVGLRYIAPDYIDPKLLDVKYVFKETEQDLITEDNDQKIESIQKLFEKKKHRAGYDDDMPVSMHRSVEIENWLNTDAPLNIFAKYNAIKMTPEEKERYTSLVKGPDDLDIMLSDLKVLGKREV